MSFIDTYFRSMNIERFRWNLRSTRIAVDALVHGIRHYRHKHCTPNMDCGTSDWCTLCHWNSRNWFRIRLAVAPPADLLVRCTERTANHSSLAGTSKSVDGLWHCKWHWRRMRWCMDRRISGWSTCDLTNSHRLWCIQDTNKRQRHSQSDKCHYDCMATADMGWLRRVVVCIRQMDRRPFDRDTNKSDCDSPFYMLHRNRTHLDMGQCICCSHKPSFVRSPNWWRTQDDSRRR